MMAASAGDSKTSERGTINDCPLDECSSMWPSGTLLAALHGAGGVQGGAGEGGGLGEREVWKGVLGGRSEEERR